MMVEKKRLDLLLHERGLAETRSKAQAMIMAGEVFVDGQKVDKAGTKFAESVQIQLKDKPLYVSRGGEKLAGALADFAYSVEGLLCADVGASTGGFTDCLLQKGAAKVYAIDVGYGQLAHKLRVDERVVVMERINARYIEALADKVQLVVVDASFISLRVLLPAMQSWLAQTGDIIALIKPQFEAGKDDVRRGGVVKDSEVHARVIREVAEAAAERALRITGLTVSPLKGLKEGNTEFLIWLHQGEKYPAIDLETAIAETLARV
jgi:23S rRNA (cytidine1920-2'-O)/16S rRNA (cytidine1409-2'-O)-methyltransferase